MDKFKCTLRISLVMMLFPAMIFLYGWSHYYLTGAEFDYYSFAVTSIMMMSLPWMAVYVLWPVMKFIMGIKD